MRTPYRVLHDFFFPPPPPPPTPLEKATATFIGAQLALLDAKNEQERADANVAMFETRVDRLRLAIRELTEDGGKA